MKRFCIPQSLLGDGPDDPQRSLPSPAIPWFITSRAQPAPAPAKCQRSRPRQTRAWDAKAGMQRESLLEKLSWDGLTTLTPSSWAAAQAVLCSKVTFICCCCHKLLLQPSPHSLNVFPHLEGMRQGPYKWFLSLHTHSSTPEEIQSYAQNEARPAENSVQVV